MQHISNIENAMHNMKPSASVISQFGGASVYGIQRQTNEQSEMMKDQKRFDPTEYAKKLSLDGVQYPTDSLARDFGPSIEEFKVNTPTLQDICANREKQMAVQILEQMKQHQTEKTVICEDQPFFSSNKDTKKAHIQKMLGK